MKIEIISGKAHISDPCYSSDTWCAGSVDNMRNGVYHCYGILSEDGAWGKRVAEISILHDNVFGSSDNKDWELLDINVGVDSGQCGIFDYEYYMQHGGADHNREDNSNEFYDKACDITLGTPGYGVFDNSSFVSSSGYGDGSYNAYKLMDDGKVVGIKVVFIGDEEGN